MSGPEVGYLNWLKVQSLQIYITFWLRGMNTMLHFSVGFSDSI